MSGPVLIFQWKHMGGGKIGKEVMTSPHQHPKLSSAHTKKRRRVSGWATVHVGAALLGRIDNNNSREITSLVVAVEPCVQKATNPISKLFIGHSTVFPFAHHCLIFFFLFRLLLYFLGCCCCRDWSGFSSRSMFGSGRRDPPHTHTQQMCVCVAEDTEQQWPTFWGLFSDDVVVVVCPRNHGASVVFFLSLSSVRWYPKLFSGWMIIGNCFFSSSSF